MTEDDRKKLDWMKSHTAFTVDRQELALGYLRYEMLRQMDVSQFAKLFEQNLSGKNFDSSIDELIINK